MKDYYNILGVSKNASNDEIKRAYRKLAHEHHPDKESGNEDKFKEINEAYQILSDEKKRAQYDQFGTTGEGGGFNWGANQSGSWDFQDFGGFGGFGGFGDIFEGIFSQAFSQVQTEIQINLTQALLGDKIELQNSNGERFSLNIPSGTQDGTTFKFRGLGNTHRKGRGDLLVTVRVKLPKKLSREQKGLLEQLKRTGM